MTSVPQAKVLLIGDVNAIKEYVFEATSLPQIRGGSSLLIQCEEEIKALFRSDKDAVIYCGGGSFILEVPRDQVVNLKKKIEAIYLQKTLTATVSVAAEAAHAAALPTSQTPSTLAKSELDGWAGRLSAAERPQVSEFARRVDWLGARLRTEKLSPHSAPFLEALPLARRCDTCGKRMAAVTKKRGWGEEAEEQHLCPVCLRRHNEGVQSHVQGARGVFNGRFFEFLQETFPQAQARQADDLEDLAGSGARKYIAFLYVDGNSIGKLLQAVHDRAQYKALSEALRTGVEVALFKALSEVCQAELETNQVWPFEIVNVGGDDVTVILQAGYAWEAAVRFLDLFEEEVNKRAKAKIVPWPIGFPERITASGGLIIADSHYPISRLERLAGDLLKSAKKRAKAQTPVLSALDFFWLRSPVAAESVEPLMAVYEGETFDLSARPYSLEEAKNVQKLVREAARELERTQRHTWGEALEDGPVVSVNAIYYNLARMRDKKQQKMRQFLDDTAQVIAAGSTGSLGPWVYSTAVDDQPAHTALLDVLELAEIHAMRPVPQEAAS